MAIKDLTQVEKHLFICNGGSCAQKGAEESTQKIRQYIADEGMDAQVHTSKTYCNGRCNDGPIVIAMPENIWFRHITPDACRKFVQHFVVKNQPLEEKILFTYTNKELQTGQPDGEI